MTLLHSQILGEGKPFVILHGFLGMSDNWKTLGLEWSTMGYEVHLLDQRNHGRSFQSLDFNYSFLAEDLKNYCDHYELKNIILLGHSMGGKVAMHFADRFPGLISKLIIADIAPKEYPAHHGDIFHALKSLDLSAVTKRSQVDEHLANFIEDEGTRLFLAKNLYRLDSSTFAWRFNLDVLAQNQVTIGQHEDIKKQIQVETLFIKGERSGYILEEDSHLLNYAFAKAKLVTIKGAGHWLHAEKPEEFLTIVNSFIQ